MGVLEINFFNFKSFAFGDDFMLTVFPHFVQLPVVKCKVILFIEWTR